MTQEYRDSSREYRYRIVVVVSRRRAPRAAPGASHASTDRRDDDA